MLKAQRRHRTPCRRPEWDQGYTKCTCPIVIRGTLAGKPVTISTAKYLPPEKSRDLEAARSLAILWEQRGAPVRPEGYAPAPAEPKAPLPTVEMGVAAFMADARDGGNSVATLYKKHIVFESALLRFCAGKGIRFVSELSQHRQGVARQLERGVPFPIQASGPGARVLVVLRAGRLAAPKLRLGHHARPW